MVLGEPAPRVAQKALPRTLAGYGGAEREEGGEEREERERGKEMKWKEEGSGEGREGGKRMGEGGNDRGGKEMGGRARVRKERGHLYSNKFSLKMP